MPPGSDPIWSSLPQARLVLAQSDFGEVRRVLTWPDCPAGPNMALRRSALGGDLYFAAVSRQSDSLPLEDSRLFKRASEAGETVMYLPSTKVAHRVRADQLNLDYFCRRYAQSLVGQWWLDGSPRLSALPVPPFLLRRLATAACRAASSLAGRRETRLGRYIDFRGELALVGFLLRHRLSVGPHQPQDASLDN
jgi:hypothetical protein